MILRHLLLTALAAGLAPGPPRVAGAASVPGPAATSEGSAEAAFEADWQVVERYLRDQHWDRARERLLPLLDAHREAPYVLLRRPRIVDALERIGFYRRHREPRVEDLVRGDLVRWRPHSGQIEVRYEPGEMGDFLVRDPLRGGYRHLEPPAAAEDLVLHPAQFAGPCKITIRGTDFAPAAVAPAVLAGVDVDSRLVASLGFRARVLDNRRVHALPGIAWSDRGHEQSLASAPTAPIETGASYTVELELGHDSVVLSVDGREFLRTRRPRGPYGRLGLRGFPDVQSVTLEGKIEPAWLEGLVDSAIQRQWIEFRQQRDAQADLPEWLRMPAPRWDLGLQDPSTVRTVAPEVREALSAVQELLDRDEVARAREVAEALAGGDDPLPGQIARLLVETAQGNWDDALAVADAIVQAEPRLRYVRRFRAAIELMLHDLDSARVHLREELALDPGDTWVPARLARLELLAGNLDAVDDVLRRAARDGTYNAELDDVNRTLSKARTGPPWARIHEYRYGRFVVRSDIDRATCLDASRTLNTGLALFEKWLRPLPAARREPFSVYLFSGQWGYLAYGDDVLEFAPENTAGVYSPWLRQLLIWNLPQREEMLATVRHEAFHQYLDSLVGVSPMWLNEGLAEVWEAADPGRFDGRRIPVAGEHASLLQGAGTLIPLERFLYMDRSEFMSRPSFHYAQAWALVHMLFQDSRAGRHVLLDLIDRLADGQSPEAATRAAFARQDLAQLDRALAEHVRGL